jgi:hypothetical protein
VHARDRPGEHVGLRHVARAVAEEGDGEPGERSAVLADGEEVGEKLARVELVAQRVDDGDRRVERHLLEAALRVGAPDDGRHHPFEHPCRVARGLLATQLAVGGGDDQRAATEVGDADGEGDAGARGRLVEDHRDRLRAGERLDRIAVSLEFDGEIEDLELLGLAEVVVA